MKTLQFDSQISNIEKMNPLFSTCNVRVLYTGVNRNGSSISQDVVDKSLYSIYNLPIVGEFIENKDDFGGHGGKIEITDSEVKYIRTTIPYGTVPESAKVYWEDVEENNGTINKYLNIEGALLWTGRYQEALKVIEEGRPQSMEIEVNDGIYNQNKIYEITDMVFSALCILGEDVEACFESANISTYSLNKDKFKQEFKQMMDELKFSLNKENYKINQNGLEGGNGMEETKEELVQEEFEVKEESPKENSEFDVEGDDEATEDESEEETMSKDEPDGDEEGKDVDNDGDGKYELLETELTTLKESYSLLESEVKELREYKVTKLHEEKEIKIHAVFESVADELSEEELAPFKEKAFEMEVDELNKELFALIGKKATESKSKFSVGKPNSISMSIVSDIPQDTTIANSYDAIIKKYNNK